MAKSAVGLPNSDDGKFDNVAAGIDNSQMDFDPLPSNPFGHVAAGLDASAGVYYGPLGYSDANIVLKKGSGIPSHSNSRNNYTFRVIDFSDIECIAMEINKSPEMDSNQKKLLRDFMADKEMVIWIHPIGGNYGTGGLSHGTNGMQEELLSNQEKVWYSQHPCGILTSNGSIIPMPIVPGKAYRGQENGMIFKNDTSQACSYINKEGKTGFNWVAEPMATLTDSHTETTMYDQDEMDAAQTYGEKNISHGYVTNENGGGSFVDVPIYNERNYMCSLEASEAGRGSCVLCHKSIYDHATGQGIKQKEKDTEPMLSFTLNGTTAELDEINKTVKNGKTYGKDIAVSIPPKGEIEVRVGGISTVGALGEVANDIMPACCPKNADGTYDLYPAYIYPTYFGLVVTNSLLNGAEKGHAVVCKYDNAVRSPFIEAKVKNVAMSDEVRKLMKEDSGNEIAQWFPALYQECPDKSDIRIQIKSDRRVKFDNLVSVKWTKSLGRFAYCPLYFHRRLVVTLYFKGKYVKPGTYENLGEYSFYPMVCSDVAESTADDWIGITKDGARCVNGAREVISSSDLRTTIYAVDFVFEATEFQRYPIELFGAVAVYTRKDFQFDVDNDNGKFVFDKPVMPQFTRFYNYQQSLSDAYLALVKQCKISSNLTGISGDMTLDGYPLAQGITKMAQDQSVGEMDLGVDIGGARHDIFSGYAMELQTSNSGSTHDIGVKLYGVDRKMTDMQLFAAPFWDGDRLEMVCAYFEEYMKLQIKMVDHTVTHYADAKPVTRDLEKPTGTWKADTRLITGEIDGKSPDFRLQRSVDWRNPRVQFPNGTPCFEALKQLGEQCGCTFVPQLDGTCTFYELNNYGYPFYVDNQVDIVEFNEEDIVSITISPQLDNKYNTVATFGFLQQPKGSKFLPENSVEMASLFSRARSKEMPEMSIKIPWARVSVGVETAMVTWEQFKRIHRNKVSFASKEQYSGQLTVPGNNRVNHMYQRVNVCGMPFFVNSIDHSVDLQSKVWTTSYTLQYISTIGGTESSSSGL